MVCRNGPAEGWDFLKLGFFQCGVEFAINGVEFSHNGNQNNWERLHDMPPLSFGFSQEITASMGSLGLTKRHDTPLF